MKKGDLAAFASGTGICHTFLNNGDREATLLVGGEASTDTNRIFYPSIRSAAPIFRRPDDAPATAP